MTFNKTKMLSEGSSSLDRSQRCYKRAEFGTFDLARTVSEYAISGLYSDLEILGVGGPHFEQSLPLHVHSAVLASTSLTLYEILTATLSDRCGDGASPSLLVLPAEQSVVGALVRFVYHGSIRGSHEDCTKLIKLLGLLGLSSSTSVTFSEVAVDSKSDDYRSDFSIDSFTSCVVESRLTHKPAVVSNTASEVPHSDLNKSFDPDVKLERSNALTLTNAMNCFEDSFHDIDPSPTSSVVPKSEATNCLRETQTDTRFSVEVGCLKRKRNARGVSTSDKLRTKPLKSSVKPTLKNHNSRNLNSRKHKSKQVVSGISNSVHRHNGTDRKCEERSSRKSDEAENFIPDKLEFLRDSEIVEGEFKCSICQKCFAKKDKLLVHLRTHRGEKPYECQICQQRFTQNGTLIAHMRIHSGHRPYACAQCPQKFNQSPHLSRHVRAVHNKEKPFHCTFADCQRSFTIKPHLAVHIRIHHTHEKPYQCDVCARCFSMSHHLTEHMKVHSGIRPFTCSTCGKAFSLLGNLSKHSQIHSGEKRFQCDICARRFLRNSHLKKHLVTHQNHPTEETISKTDEHEKNEDKPKGEDLSAT